jgi:hypothetical protein
LQVNQNLNTFYFFYLKNHMTQSNSSSRRSFLKAGAILGAGLLTAPAVSTVNANENTANHNARKDLFSIKQRRTLGTGKHKLEVSALGLGCMGMSYHRSFIPDKKVSVGLIREAVEMGVNFFDTAEAYGPFTNEELVGEALAPFERTSLYVANSGSTFKTGNCLV